MKTSIRQRVLEFVTANGPASISNVLAAVGRYITAAAAKRALDHQHRGYPRKSAFKRPIKCPEYVGKRAVVTDALVKLCKSGFIRRVSTGVYARKEAP